MGGMCSFMCSKLIMDIGDDMTILFKHFCLITNTKSDPSHDTLSLVLYVIFYHMQINNNNEQ